MNHRGRREAQRGKGKELRSIARSLLLLKSHFALRALPFALFLCVLCGSLLPASAQTPKAKPKLNENIDYQINLALDFDNRTYTGTEKIRWINRGDHPTSTLFFHLYPNMRPPG